MGILLAVLVVWVAVLTALIVVVFILIEKERKDRNDFETEVVKTFSDFYEALLRCEKVINGMKDGDQ